MADNKSRLAAAAATAAETAAVLKFAAAAAAAEEGEGRGPRRSWKKLREESLNDQL